VEDFLISGQSSSISNGGLGGGAVLGAHGQAITPVGRLEGVKLVDGEVIPADMVILSVGHSARVIYDRLAEKGVTIEPKPIAVRP
jgi:uncharacterized FAD-dependent dehydrogenase